MHADPNSNKICKTARKTPSDRAALVLRLGCAPSQFIELFQLVTAQPRDVVSVAIRA
jgi:hypothetical protein